MSDAAFFKSVGGTMVARGNDPPGWNFGWAKAAVPPPNPARRFAAVAPDLMDAAADKAVFLWEAERSVIGKLLGPWNQKSVGSCFPAGTLVRMEDGRHKPIDKLLLCESVVTAEGNTGRVTHLFSRRHRGDLCTLVLWGHSHLKATPEHPILTRRGYVPVGELTADDWVAMPRHAPTGAAVVVTADHVDARTRKFAQSGSERKFKGVLGRGSTTVTVAPLPDTLTLDADAGLVLGLFLAEGNTESSKTVWTFNKNEKETLAADLVAALRRLGVEGRLQERGGHNTVKVIVYGAHWAKLFESLCATGSGEKRVHPDLAGGPPDFLRSLLNGWLSGDGYASRRIGHKDHGVTVSHGLALDMLAIGTALGDRPSIVRSEPKISHGVKIRRPRWDVKYHSLGDNYRVEQDARYVWRKVRWVNREDYDGWVYNFEVEGDNSYVAEGIGVHNCVSHGVGRAVQDAMLLEIAAGQPYRWPDAQVCREAIYGGSRVEIGGGQLGNGDGSVGEWAMKFVKQYGVILYAKYPGYDLTGGYTESRCRQWGSQGLPDALEPTAREHPVTDYAQVRSAEELWSALGAGKPVSPCSGKGFTMTLDRDGFCRESGSWGHCQEFRARFTHPTRGRAVVVQNSWDDYLNSDGVMVAYVADDGSTKTFALPGGCYCITLDVAGEMCEEDDTWAVAGVSGWAAVRVDNTP